MSDRKSLEHPANAKLVAFLSGRARAQALPCSLPEDFEDPYRELGSHPDIVERLWDQLAEALPADCRGVVYGTPGLMHPGSGVILAVALGTEYALRIHASDQEEARASGLQQSHEYATTREQLELGRHCGSDWFFGAWHEQERVWCAKSFARAT
jgi:hypothetical protein